MRSIIRFSLLLFALLALAFTVHAYLLNRSGLPVYGDRILAAYGINYFLAVLIYAALYLLRNRMTAQLGFIYMGGSLVKFIFFFIFFYPYYKLDGELSTLEFAAFFTPYVLSLIAETSGVINFLKN